MIRLDPHPSELISAERFLHRRLRNRLNDALDGHGFSYSQFEVMVLLESRPRLHAGEIARLMRLSRQSIRGLVHKLSGGGLVDIGPPDGGIRAIELTDLGLRRARTAWRVLDGTVHAALAQIPGPERRTILEAMERCERTLAPLRPPWWLD
ncbi:MAG TPA: MarR family winged helix-turn-helix transcriptional regulator [Actinomycetota bacterium]|nr:MarR family winged helix-turn-helix transcriptional regulator [Actinomycetota bacterium]